MILSRELLWNILSTVDTIGNEAALWFRGVCNACRKCTCM